MAPYWTNYKCNSWRDAIKYYDKINSSQPAKWIFRGEIYIKETYLYSSFDNKIAEAGIRGNKKRWKYEAGLLRYFKRKAQLYMSTQETPKEEDCLEWLSLMRHYGVPSRLVDFTYSFYVAYYFAIKHAKRKDTPVVWAINMEWLEERRRSLERRNDIAGDHKVPEIFKKLIAHEKPDKQLIPVAPLRLNDRINRQHGLLLFPWDVKSTFRENLEGMPNYKKNVIRFELKSTIKAKKEALENLKNMNISSETLFHGLGGLCESLEDCFFTGKDLIESKDKCKLLSAYDAVTY